MPFLVANDVTLGAVSTAAGKQALPLAEVVHMALKEKGIPDIGVQFHKLSPLMVIQEARHLHNMVASMQSR